MPQSLETPPRVIRDVQFAGICMPVPPLGNVTRTRVCVGHCHEHLAMDFHDWVRYFDLA